MVPSLAAGFWGVTNLSGCRCPVYQIRVVLCRSHTPLENQIIRIESWKGRPTAGWATVPVDAVVLGDRLPLTSVSLPNPLSKRFSPAAPLAPKRRRLPPPGSLPGSPPRRAPVPPDPWLASRLCSRPTRASLVSGEPGRQSSSASSPGREPYGSRGGREAPSGLLEGRESRDYGSPGPEAHPRTGPEAGPSGSYCFTLSPSASLKFFLAASSSLTKVAIAPRVSGRPQTARPTATSNRKINSAEGLRSGPGRLDSTGRPRPQPLERRWLCLVLGPARLTVGRAPG